MTVSFKKMNGLGNDFVLIDDMDELIDLTPTQVALICDRHFGIGGDGIILVRPPKHDDCLAYMHYINSDGTLAQMCGNGVRCFSKFLVDGKYVDEVTDSFIVDTLAGPRPISFTRNADGSMKNATVGMGRPVFEPERIPVDCETDAVTPDGTPYVRALCIDSPWGQLSFTCLSMGNPHAVCFVNDWNALPDDAFAGAAHKSLDTLDLARVGAFFEQHPVFPEKANIEFAEKIPEGIRMRVYERGCAETLACGTGACAVNVAAALTQDMQRGNDVHLLGGVLHIDWLDDGTVIMTGPASCSFEGTVDLSVYDQ